MLTEDSPSYHPLSGAPGSALGCKFQPSGSIGREIFKSAHPRGFPCSSGCDRKSSSECPEIRSLLQTPSLGDGPSAMQGKDKRWFHTWLIITTNEKTEQHRPTRTFFCWRGIGTHPVPVSTTTDLSACTSLQKNSIGSAPI